jgi:hypothetical protein
MKIVCSSIQIPTIMSGYHNVAKTIRINPNNFTSKQLQAYNITTTEEIHVQTENL